MVMSRAVLHCSFAALFLSTLSAQQPSPEPTIQVNSRLVFLDVTVVDKKGRPVVAGLSKDDFTVTEDKQPQRITSFEAPAIESGVAADPARTVLVLDLLNTSFNDASYVRYSLRKYLEEQPAQLRSPTALFVLGNQSLEMAQAYTQSRADLLAALAAVPPMVPYKKMNWAFNGERFGQSLYALEQIALQNRGIGGRKAIVWVGRGSPGLSAAELGPYMLNQVDQAVRDATNMLVDTRMSLFLVFPGVSAGAITTASGASANRVIGDEDPFASDINFGVLVNASGGKLFQNRNDIDREVAQAEELGSQSYTLTYQPPDAPEDGSFRRIRVTVRDPNLRVITKVGYFGPNRGGAIDPGKQMLVTIAEAAQATIPFDGLSVTIAGLVWHPDTRTAEFVAVLKSRHLVWQPEQDGHSTVELRVAAVSLDKSRELLTSRVGTFDASYPTQEQTTLDRTESHFPLRLRVPRAATGVRVVLQTKEGGLLGSADLSLQALESAPQTPTPEPALVPRTSR